MTVNQCARGRRLAVVDDNDEFRAVIRAVAEPLGWQVSEFADGKKFLAAVARDYRPDLLMLDMVMPNMDGIETIGALGASSIRCRVLLMTGRLPLYTRTAEELARAHGIEIASLLHKPFPIAQLRAELVRAADAPSPGPGHGGAGAGGAAPGENAWRP